MRALSILLLLVTGCGDKFDGPQVLAGVEVSASILDSGRRVYVRNCAPCHGEAGDGRGPGAMTSTPPPRDFRTAKFKYAGIRDRGLPHDDELVRIISNGLAGTPMPSWDLPESELRDVIDYIKTFSPEGNGFRDPKLAVSKPEIGADPFTTPAEIEAATARGRDLYHQIFECAKCHPSYIDESRPTPAPKWSDTYSSILVPTDFRRHEMRSVRTADDGRPRTDDLFRVIAYGLQGPMPGYIHLGARDVWAVAHYVRSIE